MTDILEWNRTQFALNRPVDVPALLDALEEAVNERDECDLQAAFADDYAGELEEALVDLAAAAKASGLPALAAAADEALSAIPPPRRALLEA